MIDLAINERMELFNRNNMSLCESICIFKGYVKNNIICQCDIKFKFNSFYNVNSSKYSLIYRFKQVETKNLNLWVLKCYFNIFTKDIIMKNFCSIIILVIILLTFGGAIYFCTKESNILNDKIFMLYEVTMKKIDANFSLDNSKNIYFFEKDKNNIEKINNAQKRNDIKKSPTRTVIKTIHNNIFLHQSSKNILNFNKKKIFNPNEMKSFEKYTDNEMNNFPYYNALLLDRRNFFQIYFSLIKTKHLLIFALNCENDFNPRTMKINFMFFIFAIFLASNTFFVNETTIHNLFIYKGKIEVLSDFSKILYSILISLSIKNLLLLIAFPELDIVKIRKIGKQNLIKRNKLIKKSIGMVIIKCHIFFFINIILLSMNWVYISCFFIIFQNTQMYVIRNTLMSFGISLVLPMVLYLIPTLFRKLGIKGDGSHGCYCFFFISTIFQVLF